MRALRIILLAIALGACTQGQLAVPDMQGSSDARPAGEVDFAQMLWWARRAGAAYDPPDAIRKALPEVVHVRLLDGLDVQYFIEKSSASRLQTIAVRGTSNMENAWIDAEYAQARDLKLNVWMHAGFDRAARAVLSDALPHLDKGYRTRVTGHSLGAAIATIVMMYLHEAGYPLERSINFGQPKVTNRAGVHAYAFLPLVRVVHAEDPVPLVPPVTLLDSIHGIYEHLGEELILLKGPFYTSLVRHDAERRSIGSFWRSLGRERLGDHFMARYFAAIEEKLTQPQWVPYAERSRYE